MALTVAEGRAALVLVFAALLSSNAVLAGSEEDQKTLPYKYESPPPPPSCKVEVTGSVFCDLCQNGKMKMPLKGVKVGVFCWNGYSELSFYGYTDAKGCFTIDLSGFDYLRCGAKACAAKLVGACYDTPCVIPTDLNGGNSGGALYEKSKSDTLIVLTTGPFSYESKDVYNKCYTQPPYKYQSPPPPY